MLSRPGRGASFAAACLSLAGVLSCGASPPPEPTAPEAPAAAPDAPAPGASAAEPPAMTRPAGVVKNSSPAGAADETTQVSARDCDDLAQHLREMTRAGELAKVDPAANALVRAKAEKASEKAADTASSEFAANCASDLQNKLVRSAQLRCLYRSKVVAEFRDCTRL